jgi:hypothetical protein
MSRKRALQSLKQAEAEVKRLMLEVEKGKENDVMYMLEEFGIHLERVFPCVRRCEYETNNNRYTIMFSNGCTLEFLYVAGEPPGKEKTLRVDGVYLITFSLKSNCCGWQARDYLRDSAVSGYLSRLAEIFEDARRIAREEIPHWFGVIAPGIDVESLQTTRALQWIAKQYGEKPLADVLRGSLVPLFLPNAAAGGGGIGEKE